VVSDARKARGNPGVKRWIAEIDSDELFLSVLVVGEIRQGIERLQRRDPNQAKVFERWLATLRRDHGDRVLPVTTSIAEEWGRLNVPDPLPVVDGLLAATAKVHGLTLVTRNTAQVKRTGAQLLNPFS
jgi:predicted nucleic acid-binding protein